MRDFGAALKDSSFEKAYSLLQDLCLIFHSLTPTSQYTRATLFYLLLIEHWKTTNAPTFKLLQKSFNSFVEEDGELSFSVLSRSTLKDTNKSNFQFLNSSYQAQLLYLEATKDLQNDFGVFANQSSHEFILETQQEVKSLKTFLESFLTSIHLNCFKFHCLPKNTKFLEPTVMFFYFSPTFTEFQKLTLPLSAFHSFSTCSDFSPLFLNTLADLQCLFQSNNFHGSQFTQPLEPPSPESSYSLSDLQSEELSSSSEILSLEATEEEDSSVLLSDLQSSSSTLNTDLEQTSDMENATLFASGIF